MNTFLNIGIFHYLALSFLLLLTGLLGVLISRNMLQVVMSLFIMTTATVIDFVTFGFYSADSTAKTSVISTFIIIIATIQTLIALVILYKIHKSNEYWDTEKIKDRED